MWIQREIEETLSDIVHLRSALILTGCRQAGKTSLLRRIFPGHTYVSLDIPTVAEQAELSGNDFLAKHPQPLIVDEVQYAPVLLRHIKASIDAHRDSKGLFLITGSQKFPLMQGVTESLAGRAAVLDLHSLSAREYERWTGEAIERKQLIQWMFRGSYPELCANDLSPDRFYSDYLVTYLERDVRSVLQVRSLRDFDRFLRLCASRTGQLLSYNALATDLGVSPNTIKSWISVLEASGIIHLLEPYYSNLGKRIVKSPKLYFLDTGLVCYLIGMRSPEDLEKSIMVGAIFETHVLGQIVRHFANRGVRVPVYFYRDHWGHEVDFLIPSGERFELIECKWAEFPSVKQSGFEEIEKLVSTERIISKSIVTPARGRRLTKNGIVVADSVGLDFLQDQQKR